MNHFSIGAAFTARDARMAEHRPVTTEAIGARTQTANEPSLIALPRRLGLGVKLSRAPLTSGVAG